MTDSGHHDPVGGADSARLLKGTELARRALAAAKAEARRRGLTTGAVSRGGAGPDGAGTDRRRRVDAATRSGAHPDERDPQTFDVAVERLVADHGWQTDAAVGGVLGRWGAIVGRDIAEHSTPVSFDDGELTVVASSTAWATQLRLLAPTLLDRLSQDVGPGTVTRLRVLGPPAPSWGRGPLRVRGRGPRDTYG